MQASVFALTGILDLDGGVGLRVGFVNHLSADLLRQNLQRQMIAAVGLMPKQSAES